MAGRRLIATESRLITSLSLLNQAFHTFHHHLIVIDHKSIMADY